MIVSQKSALKNAQTIAKKFALREHFAVLKFALREHFWKKFNATILFSGYNRNIILCVYFLNPTP